MSNGRLPNDEDFFAHTRMSLGDHIEDLRGCLFRALRWFVLAMIVGFFVAKYVLVFISAPIEAELMDFHEQRYQKKKAQLAAGNEKMAQANEPRDVKLSFSAESVQTLARLLGVAAPQVEDSVEMTVKIKPLDILDATRSAELLFVRPPLLRTLTVLEGFVVWLKVAMYCGFVIAAPLILRELWSFVAAGLYPTEKALVWRALPLSILLFLGGVALCQFVLLPIGIHYLIGFNAWLDIEPELRLTDWISFAVFTPMIFGVAFQTPLVMFILDRVGILSVELYLAYWRIAVFLIILLSGFMAPSPDPISMLALGLPVSGLYFLGIGMCYWWPRPRVDLDVEDPEEPVEV